MAEQTTQERIADMILDSIDRSTIDFDTGYNPDPLAKTIAAEIDGLRAEIARLKPAAEAWETQQAMYAAWWGPLEIRRALEAKHDAAANRARAAAKERR